MLKFPTLNLLKALTRSEARGDNEMICVYKWWAFGQWLGFPESCCFHFYVGWSNIVQNYSNEILNSSIPCYLLFHFFISPLHHVFFSASKPLRLCVLLSLLLLDTCSSTFPPYTSLTSLKCVFPFSEMFLVAFYCFI